MKLVIVVPAYNESAVILEVLKAIPKKFAKVDNFDLLIIDDGSTDNTRALALKSKAKVISHVLNRGVGAATRTGFEYAKTQNADILLTFDADGQHHPQDIEKVIKPIIDKKADLVIGSRFFKRQKIPLDRLIINWFANFATLILFGVFSSDTQSGFRAFSKKAIHNLDFKGQRMDFSSEILLEAKRNNLVKVEVPIRAIYTQYSRRKGQRNIHAFPIFARLLVKLLR